MLLYHVQSLILKEHAPQRGEAKPHKEVVTVVKAPQNLNLSLPLPLSDLPPLGKHGLTLPPLPSLHLLSDKCPLIGLLKPTREHFIGQFLVCIFLYCADQTFFLALSCQRMDHTPLQV